MRIATWNINSVRTRIERLTDWLQRSEVDVVALQETKCRDDQFPGLELSALGYEVAHFGLNQWNGVAILSRVGLEDERPQAPAIDHVGCQLLVGEPIRIRATHVRER